MLVEVFLVSSELRITLFHFLVFGLLFDLLFLEFADIFFLEQDVKVFGFSLDDHLYLHLMTLNLAHMISHRRLKICQHFFLYVRQSI